MAKKCVTRTRENNTAKGKKGTTWQGCFSDTNKTTKDRKPKKPKAKDPEWQKGYLYKYAFSAKASKFATFEDAMGSYNSLSTEDKTKVAGITHHKQYGKEVFSLRKGHGGVLYPDLKNNFDKSLRLN